MQKLKFSWKFWGQRDGTWGVAGRGADFHLGRGKAQLLQLHLSFGDVPSAFRGPVPGFWGRLKTVS